MSGIKLLYIEDDIDTAEELIEIFHILKINNMHAKNYNDAVDLYRNNSFNLIITDIELSSNKNGIDFIKNTRMDDKNIPIIITSAYTSIPYMIESIELNIVRYLVKPISLDNLRTAIDKVYTILNGHNDIIKFDNDFNYYFKNKHFIQYGKIINITNQEILLIEFLIINRRNIVSFQSLQCALRIDQEISIDSLRTIIKKLRKNTYREIIESISKIGYRLR